MAHMIYLTTPTRRAAVRVLCDLDDRDAAIQAAEAAYVAEYGEPAALIARVDEVDYSPLGEREFAPAHDLYAGTDAMKMRAAIEIPETSSVGEVRDVVEFLSGIGEVTRLDFHRMRIDFEFEASDAASDAITRAIIHAAGESLPESISHDGDFKAVTAIVAEALVLMERWNDVEVELASRGWTAPRTATVSRGS